MGKPTDPTAPHQTLDQLIGEAFEATGVLPPYERCIEINRALRDAISDLYRTAQEQAATHPERSRDWYRLHNLLRDADTALAGGLGDGLLSAATRLSALARVARNLRIGTTGH